MAVAKIWGVLFAGDFARGALLLGVYIKDPWFVDIRPRSLNCKPDNRRLKAQAPQADTHVAPWTLFHHYGCNTKPMGTHHMEESKTLRSLKMPAPTRLAELSNLICLCEDPKLGCI